MNNHSNGDKLSKHESCSAQANVGLSFMASIAIIINGIHQLNKLADGIIFAVRLLEFT